jgi:hypothetical protein
MFISISSEKINKKYLCNIVAFNEKSKENNKKTKNNATHL